MRFDGAPRLSLAGGQSDRSGSWPSRVWMTMIPDDRAAAIKRRQRRHHLEQLIDVVAEALAESAGQQEVSLHVDDDQRGLARDETER